MDTSVLTSQRNRKDPVRSTASVGFEIRYLSRVIDWESNTRASSTGNRIHAVEGCSFGFGRMLKIPFLTLFSVVHQAAKLGHPAASSRTYPSSGEAWSPRVNKHPTGFKTTPVSQLQHRAVQDAEWVRLITAPWRWQTKIHSKCALSLQQTNIQTVVS